MISIALRVAIIVLLALWVGKQAKEALQVPESGTSSGLKVLPIYSESKL
jgi:hypothetical protein